MATPVSGANTWLTLNGKPLVFQDTNENLHARAIEGRNNFLRAQADAPGPLEIFVDDELLDTSVYGSWYWRPEWHAGLYELRAEAPGYEPQKTMVRVLPAKLTQKRYEQMLVELDAIATELLFRLNSPAGEKAVNKHRAQENSPLRDYRLLLAIMEQLSDVMEHIRRHPYRVLYETNAQRLFHEVYQFSNEAIALPGEVFLVPEARAGGSSSAMLPVRWQVKEKVLTYDVHENRLLKQFVQHQLMNKLAFLKARAESEMKRREQQRLIKLSRGWTDDETEEIEKLKQVLSDCELLTRRCIAWSSEPFLTSVKRSPSSSRATQVLLKHPFYSRFYHLYLQFQQELQIHLDTERYLTTLALRKMWDLYEIWSIFRISLIILDELTNAGYTFLSSNLFYEIERNAFQFEVRKDSSRIVLGRGDRRVEMRYEPCYYSHQSAGGTGSIVANIRQDKYLSPDLAIEVYEYGTPKHVMIFDAKYRWFREADGLHYPNDDDLDKMRMYRDRICHKVTNSRGSTYKLFKIVTSAYILYPGDVIHSEASDVIGALPLVPSMAVTFMTKVEGAVKKLLRLAHLL
ncbi:MAG TPA: DUF2357 domain-containing protein [Ktedonobacteraceae bacterium]|nr:DUF2357 domain-containing protein [Ktedonobacteraceae bacterium]